MRFHFRLGGFLLALTFCLSSAVMSQENAFKSIEQKGKELFQHVWQPRDPLSPSGDGLGPMFNARSCTACHPGGGSADNQRNVQLLSLKEKNSGRKKPSRVPEDLQRLMPFFEINGERTVILHQQSTDEAYNHARRELLDLNPPAGLPASRKRLWENRQKKKRSQLPMTRVLRDFPGLELIVSERNTPALFGGALIDSIQKADLERLEQQQARGNDGISGRISIALDGRVGKFGWRGQTSSLAGFVRGACGAELGLQSGKQVQNQNPFAPNTQLIGHDLSESQLEALNRFVASIERPEYRPWQELNLRQQRGLELFRQINCVSCHVENVGDVRGLYSDLLLHDMGPGLADPLPAMPELKFFQHHDSARGGGYLGAGFFTHSVSRREVTTNILQEWRTPPLWGVADSAPYLHDGRAETLLQAILLHQGEASESVERFRSLSARDREAVLTFLESLTIGKADGRRPAQNPGGAVGRRQGPGWGGF
ncbi:MAG: di-heme oxidoredictase family protein [Planctomycetota bacterium]|nr:di-heme oxidoredictase family protein [Planctomycetota bacterium]